MTQEPSMPPSYPLETFPAADIHPQNRSTRIKRGLAATLIVLSLLFFVLSLAGIAVTWVYNVRLTNTFLAETSTLEADLAQSRNDLQAVRAELDSAQAQIDVFQGILEKTGLDAMKNAQVVTDVVAKVDTTVSPLLDRVEGGIESVRQVLLNLKEKIEALNNLPLVNLDVPGVEQLDELAGTVQGLQDQVSEVRTKIEDLSQLTQDTLETLTTGFQNWETAIQTYRGLLDTYDARLASYQEKLAYWKVEVPKYLDWAAVILTVLLVWLAFSQAALFVAAWSFYKGEDLLARWR
jgi:TolA-binding protein